MIFLVGHTGGYATWSGQPFVAEKGGNLGTCQRIPRAGFVHLEDRLKYNISFYNFIRIYTVNHLRHSNLDNGAFMRITTPLLNPATGTQRTQLVSTCSVRLFEGGRRVLVPERDNDNTISISWDCT